MSQGQQLQARPDPRSAANAAEFVDILRRLRIWAGNPSLAVLGKQTGLARTTMHDALSPKRVALPALDLVRRLVTACGCPPPEVALWEAMWRQIQEQHTTPLFSPKRTAGVLIPRQLPADGYGFVGRAAELKRLDAILHEWRSADRGAATVTVLSGPGGVGKTALAVHWAHQVADNFPNGQLYLNLNGFSSLPPMTPTAALASLLRTLGVPSEQIPMDADAQAGLYRTALAEQRILLVLDNAVDVGQVRPLLPGTPTCLALVTSRHALGGLVAREGARRLTLERLSPEEARKLLAHSLGAERVLREEDAADELSRLCGHLPLALRIVAANLADNPHRTLAAYAQELSSGDRLAALKVAGDDETAVSAAFQSSYTRLGADAQLLFRRLGLVPGADFAVPAASILIGQSPEAAGPLLDALAAAHLLEPAAHGRFTLHELLRLFARQLSQDDGPEWTNALIRLLDWYLHSTVNAVERIRPNLVRLATPAASVEPMTFPDIQSARDWLQLERANLFACIHAAATAWPTRRYSWLLTDALRADFQLQMPKVEWREAAATGLVAAQQENDRAAEAAMRASLGDAARSNGDWDEAASQFERALELSRAAGDRRWEGALLTNLGILNHLSLGRLDAAERWFTESIDVSKSIDDLLAEAAGLTRLATVQRDQGRLGDAVLLLERAVTMLSPAEDRLMLALSLARLGSVLRYQGQWARAAEHAQRAQHIYEEIGYRAGIAGACDDHAAALIAAGRPLEAATHVRQGLAIARELGDSALESDLLITLGMAEHHLGMPESSDTTLEALRLAREGGLRSSMIRALTALAVIATQEGDQSEARTYTQEAVELARAGGLRLLEQLATTGVAVDHHAA